MKATWSTIARGGLLLALLLPVLALAPAVTADEHECQLSVEPKRAPAGSDFMLRGSGYTPTRLTLQKEGSDSPVTLDLALNGADPFEIPIGSRRGDEGVWVATAFVPGGCSETVRYRATAPVSATAAPTVAPTAVPTPTETLRPTDGLGDLLGGSSGGSPGLVVYLLTAAAVVVGGFFGGVALGRAIRRI